jgi:transposase InsO family protein
LSVIAGTRDGRCLACPPSALRMDRVQADLAHQFADLGVIPREIQTDRHPAFLGAEESDRAALPSRFTLFLAGLGIGHRLIPVRRPQCNGAVESFHGGVEQRWRGEPGGLEALTKVWNAERPPLSRRHRRYRGRAGFTMAQVWQLLGQTEVRRQVNRQGKLRLWNHDVSVGIQAAGQTVTVRFDPEHRTMVVRDAHEQVVGQRSLPWLTADWLWAPVAPTDQHAHCPDPSTC